MISQNFEAKSNKPKNEIVDPELKFKSIYYFNADNFHSDFDEFLLQEYSDKPQLVDRIIELQAALKTTKDNPDRFTSLAMKHMDKYNRGTPTQKSADYAELFQAYLATKSEPPMTIQKTGGSINTQKALPDHVEDTEQKLQKSLEKIDKLEVKLTQQYFQNPQSIQAFIKYLEVRESTDPKALKLKLKIKTLAGDGYKGLPKIMGISVFKGKESGSKYTPSRELILSHVEDELSKKSEQVFSDKSNIIEFSESLKRKFDETQNSKYLKMIAQCEKYKNDTFVFALSMNSHILNGHNKPDSAIWYESLLEYLLSK